MATYVKIFSTEVGAGGAASIDFTVIPSTYTDLCVKLSLRDNLAGYDSSNIEVRFNGSSTGYTNKYLAAQGTSTVSGAPAFGFILSVPSTGSTGSTFSNTEIYIPNYAGSAYKSFSADGTSENNSATSFYMGLSAGLWSNTAAINQVTILDRNSASFVQYSTATLYGIKNS